MENLILVRLDSKYCDYLRKFDDKVPYNFDSKKTRSFVGVLFTVNNCKYFAPLSSPKLKHKKMRTKIDFLKLDNGNLGAINFNNMIPVTEKNIVKLDLDKDYLIKSEKQYNKLLKEQLYWLNRNNQKIHARSKKLYDNYVNGKLDVNVVKRCCNFPLLEKKCKEYNKS